MSAVSIRPLERTEELEAVVDLEIAVWGLKPRDAVPSSLLHVYVLNGGAVIGAFDAERLIGVCFAFPARRDNRTFLWSHMTGVHPDFQGKGVGFDLKQSQRVWAIEHGYDEIRWTFDPLQRGNANFNLHLLGAVASTYYVNFYGEMTDSINGGLPSDRVEVVWHLRDKRVENLSAGGAPYPLAADSPVDCFLLKVSNDQRPVTDILVDSADRYFIEIPFDLSCLKRTDPDLAQVWRVELRLAFQEAFIKGYILTDFVTDGDRCWYVLLRSPVWYLYVVECSDGSLYTGVTTHLNRRVAQHNRGKGAAYTAARLPVRLVAAWQFAGRSQALRAEARFKGTSRDAKIRCVREKLPYCGAPFVELDL